MRHVFKLRSELKGEHIYTTIFSGNEGQTLVNIGTLCQRLGEWQLFGALLACGSDLNDATRQHSLVIFEGNSDVIDQVGKGEITLESQAVRISEMQRR